ALVDSPALGLYDPVLPTTVSTDASDYGLGAVLTQVHVDTEMCLGCGTYANQLQSPSTWDSATGLVQIWFDGKLSIRKYMISGAITQTAILLLGQEQDSHGGGFNINQSFVGMMSDVHMWNHTLSPCKIQNYMNKRSFTPGNVPNWKALNFQINVVLFQINYTFYFVTQCRSNCPTF
uniref:Pentraxin family member n=1 Tax=Oryzias latipes TaxID=8090 RepID=A0A3P9M935_ORYLA